MTKIALKSGMGMAALLALSGLAGCVVVGRSSGGGWFIWPGGLGLVLLILFVVFLLRRAVGRKGSGALREGHISYERCGHPAPFPRGKCD